MNNIADETLFAPRPQSRMLTARRPVPRLHPGVASSGPRSSPTDGRSMPRARISAEPYKYLHNLLEMPYVAAALLIGVVSVLWSI